MRNLKLAAINNVTIICLTHGEFQQRPANHLTGRGCHECGGNKPLTVAKFIERANAKHGCTSSDTTQLANAREGRFCDHSFTCQPTLYALRCIDS